MVETNMMDWSKMTFCHSKVMARRQEGFENANNYVLSHAIVKEWKKQWEAGEGWSIDDTEGLQK